MTMEMKTEQMQRTEGPITSEQMKTLFREGEGRVPMKTWKPTTGGVLEIVSGYLNILTGLVMLLGVSMFPAFASFIGMTAGVGIGILLIALGIVSIIGGVYALRRRVWGMALVGSITSLFPSIVLIPGILSLILVTLGRPEFIKK